MSRLTRDRTTETDSRGQILRRERRQGKVNFPVQLATCRMGNLTRLIYTLATCVTIHNVGDKPTVILYTTFIAIVVSHIQRIGRQPRKTALHSGQSRSSWSAEQGNVYSSAYAMMVAYSFLYVPGMYVWSTLSAEYDMDQTGVVANPARGHLKNSDTT